MFDMFGEFDSAEEINQAAEGQFNEGDFDALRKLAAENGIPDDITELYIAGEIPMLCDAATAAAGKIEIEMAEIRKKKKVDPDMAQAVADYMLSRADREEIAAQIRKKGKTIEGCLKEMYNVAAKKPRVNQMAVIAPAEGFRIIRGYYAK